MNENAFLEAGLQFVSFFPPLKLREDGQAGKA